MKLTKTPILIEPDFDISSIQFRVYYTPEVSDQDTGTSPGSIVTDDRGNVLGIVGNIFFLGPVQTPPELIPFVVKIESALELLLPGANERLWAKSPIGYTIVTPNWTTVSPDTPSDYEETTITINNLLNNLGEPLEGDELFSGFSLSIFQPTEGTVLVAAYAFPVELRDSSGKLLAQAKWIAIQWDSAVKESRIASFMAEKLIQ
ncbi:MAG TPA: hypothetical protein VGA85_04575 [Dehalococcoidales bacterium]